MNSTLLAINIMIFVATIAALIVTKSPLVLFALTLIKFETQIVPFYSQVGSEPEDADELEGSDDDYETTKAGFVKD